MKPINASTKIVLRKDFINHDGTQSILLRMIIGGRKRDLSLKIGCKADFWDESSRRIKKGWPNYQKLNSIIQRYESDAEEIVLKYRFSQTQVSLEQFERELKVEKSGSFIQFIELELLNETALKLQTKDTLKNYRSCFRKLKKFAPKLQFDGVTKEFLKRYEGYLKEVHQNHPNTINKNLRFVRSLINRAAEKGLTQSDPFKGYKLPSQKTSPRFLIKEELERLEKLFDTTNDVPTKKVLRVFLFCCYTGLRFSDMRKLTNGEIINSTIDIVTQKTKSPVRVPLIGKAKHLFVPGTELGSMVFDTFANQTTNRILKVIAKECGIQKRLSFHMSRHTFATLGLTAGVPIETVSKLMGHTTIKQTQTYAQVVDEKLKSDLKRLSDFLE